MSWIITKIDHTPHFADVSEGPFQKQIVGSYSAAITMEWAGPGAPPALASGYRVQVTPDLPDDVADQIDDDLFIYGNAFVMYGPDGPVRLDPTLVHLVIDSSGDGTLGYVYKSGDRLADAEVLDARLIEHRTKDYSKQRGFYPFYRVGADVTSVDDDDPWKKPDD